jgi:hypothetical protein
MILDSLAYHPENLMLANGHLMKAIPQLTGAQVMLLGARWLHVNASMKET